MVTLDQVTRSEFDAALTTNDKANAVKNAFVDPVTVKVLNASSVVVGSGTMNTPWATVTLNNLNLTDLASFTVSTTATPDPSTWKLRFESGTRWMEGSFGLNGSGAEFQWSLGTWESGMTGRLQSASAYVYKTQATADATDLFDVNAAVSVVFGWKNLNDVTINAITGQQLTYDLNQDINKNTGDVPVFTKVFGASNVTVSPTGSLVVSSSSTEGTYPIIVDLTLQPVAIPVEGTITGSLVPGAELTITGTGFGTLTSDCRVYLANADVYSAATVITTQSITSWNSTQIKFILTLGSLPSISNTTVFVQLSTGSIHKISTFSTQVTSGFTPAGPYTVNSSTGSFTDGVTLTITGSGFGTKTNVKPLLWCPLETDLQPHPTLSRVTSRTANGTASIQTGIKPTGAAGAARDLATTGTARLYSNEPIWDVGTTGETYVFVKRRYDHPTAENLKQFRFWAASFNAPDLIQSATTGGRQLYIEPENGGNADDGQVYYSTVPYVNGAWQTHEYEIKLGTVNVFDGRIRYWMNGGLAMAYNKGWRTNTTTWPSPMRWGFLDQYTVNYGGIPSGGTYYLYYNSFYADDTRHRVFVSDETSFQTGLYGSVSVVQREICIPIAWTDTSVSIVLRQGSHASLSGKSLYVVKGDGTALKIGTFN